MTTIAGLPAELTTPVDGDLMVVRDIDDATNKDKKITWANIKATLKTYFDTLYTTAANLHAATAKTTPVDADTMPLIDSAASNALKKVTWANIKATLKTYFDTLYSTKAVVVSARVYHSANQTINNNVTTTLVFNAERWDTDNLHSTVSNTSRLTAPVTGKYLVQATVAFDTNATGIRVVGIIANGTYRAQQTVPAISGELTIVSISTVIDLAAAEYTELVARQNSGVNLNVVNSGAHQYSPEFSMTLLSS